jgi:hypothetical protein
MAFAIQLVRELSRLGLHRSVGVGGVIALALAREHSPVITAFAAELGIMQVSEQDLHPPLPLVKINLSSIHMESNLFCWMC